MTAEMQALPAALVAAPPSPLPNEKRQPEPR
jgi:hypothetical protein